MDINVERSWQDFMWSPLADEMDGRAIQFE